jgi:hypothetical protein
LSNSSSSTSFLSNQVSTSELILSHLFSHFGTFALPLSHLHPSLSMSVPVPRKSNSPWGLKSCLKATAGLVLLSFASSAPVSPSDSTVAVAPSVPNGCSSSTLRVSFYNNYVECPTRNCQPRTTYYADYHLNVKGVYEGTIHLDHGNLGQFPDRSCNDRFCVSYRSMNSVTLEYGGQVRNYGAPNHKHPYSQEYSWWDCL